MGRQSKMRIKLFSKRNPLSTKINELAAESMKLKTSEPGSFELARIDFMSKLEKVYDVNDCAYDSTELVRRTHDINSYDRYFRNVFFPALIGALFGYVLSSMYSLIIDKAGYSPLSIMFTAVILVALVISISIREMGEVKELSNYEYLHLSYYEVEQIEKVLEHRMNNAKTSWS